jgi:nucleosome binding factor SPN SPT16 subunit
MAEIKIDKQLFHERLSHFYSSWKADKRSGDAVFAGAGSILVLMGKTEDTAMFQKNNAIHFWLLGYEFPATLFLFTLDALYVVTTSKKGKRLSCAETA